MNQSKRSKRISQRIVNNTCPDLRRIRKIQTRFCCDESVQDLGCELFAVYVNGMTQVYRRFRRTKIYVFCYEREFDKRDHYWFTHLRPTVHIVLAKDFEHVIYLQHAMSEFSSFKRETKVMFCKEHIGESNCNTQWMRQGHATRQMMGRLSRIGADNLNRPSATQPIFLGDNIS